MLLEKIKGNEDCIKAIKLSLIGDISLLITGDTATGKTMLLQAIHPTHKTNILYISKIDKLGRIKQLLKGIGEQNKQSNWSIFLMLDNIDQFDILKLETIKRYKEMYNFTIIATCKDELKIDKVVDMFEMTCNTYLKEFDPIYKKIKEYNPNCWEQHKDINYTTSEKFFNEILKIQNSNFEFDIDKTKNEILKNKELYSIYADMILKLDLRQRDNFLKIFFWLCKVNDKEYMKLDNLFEAKKYVNIL